MISLATTPAWRGLAHHEFGHGTIATRLKPGDGAGREIPVGVDLLGDRAGIDTLGYAGPGGVRHDGQQDDLGTALFCEKHTFSKRQDAFLGAVVDA